MLLKILRFHFSLGFAGFKGLYSSIFRDVEFGAWTFRACVKAQWGHTQSQALVAGTIQAYIFSKRFPCDPCLYCNSDLLPNKP